MQTEMVNIAIEADDPERIRALKIMNSLAPLIRSIANQADVDGCAMMSAMIIYGVTQSLLNGHDDCVDLAVKIAKEAVAEGGFEEAMPFTHIHDTMN
jgi:hypothetical protein